jgi:aminoglycoside 2'-N-acetyltransferase I
MPFDIYIKPTAWLTDFERANASEIDHQAFTAGPPEPPANSPAPEDYQIIWAQSDYHVLGFMDGTMTSILCLFRREIQVGDQNMLVAGVGSVATLPEYQRRGFAGLLLERAAAFMRDELETPFGLLVCSPHREAFYQKFGWQKIQDPMQFDTPSGKKTWPELTMFFSVDGQPWPSGVVDLCGYPW